MVSLGMSPSTDLFAKAEKCLVGADTAGAEEREVERGGVADFRGSLCKARGLERNATINSSKAITRWIFRFNVIGSGIPSIAIWMAEDKILVVRETTRHVASSFGGA